MLNVKQIKSIVSLIIVLMLLSGCMASKPDRVFVAQECLKERYGKDFEIVEVYSQKVGQNYVEMVACPLDESNILFKVTIDIKDDRMSDSYVERSICNQISNIVESNISLNDVNYFVFTHAVGPQPITSDLSLSIQEYAELDEYNRFRVNLYIDKGNLNLDNLYDELFTIFNDLEYLKTSVKLYLVNIEILENVKNYFSSHDDIYGNHSDIIRDVSEIEIEYTNGYMDMSREKLEALIG